MSGNHHTSNRIPLFTLRADRRYSDHFAEFTILSDVIAKWCPNCNRGHACIPNPLVVGRTYDRWSPNDGPIPDANWLGRFTMVTDKAKDALQAISPNLAFEPCVVDANPERQKRMGKRKQDRFQQELQRDKDVQLWRLKVPTVYETNLELSGRRLEVVCDVCSFTRIHVAPSSQVIVDRGKWGGENIFKLFGCGERLKGDPEYFGPDFVTISGHDILKRYDLTNVTFIPSGMIR